MTDDIKPNEHNPQVEEELSGDPELDERLAEPILKGHQGLDAAQVWISAFLIVIAGFMAFSNVFGVPFSRQEHAAIVMNGALHAPATLPQGILDSGTTPISAITLAVNWWLAPGKAGAFHGVNLLIHLLNAVLVFLVARRILRNRVSESVAMLAGLFFVLHPLATNAVDSLVSRSALLATSFLLAATLVYLKSMGRNDTDGMTRQYPAVSTAVGVVMMALAWGCSPAALGFPLLAIALERVAGPKEGPVRRLAPYWAAGAVLLVATLVLKVPGTAWHWSGVLSGAGGLMRKTVLPYGLSVFPVAHVSGMLGAGLLLVGIVLAILLIILRSPAGMALIWYCITLVLAMSGESSLNESAAYLALAGMVWLIPWVFALVPGREVRVAVGIVAAILVVAFGAMTYTRNHAWSNPIVLWEQAAATAPNQAAPQQELGMLFLDQAEQTLAESGAGGKQVAESDAAHYLEKARQHLTAALKNGTADVAVYSAVGRACLLSGAPKEALVAFRQALQRRPGDKDVLLLAAQTALHIGTERTDLLEAARYFERAHGLGALPADAGQSYAALLARLGRYERCAAILAELGAGQGKGPLATQYEQVSGMLRAIQQVESKAGESRKTDFFDPQGLVLQAQGDALRQLYLISLYEASAALNEQPGSWQAWVALGAAEAGTGNIAGFLARNTSAPETPANTPTAWKLLAQKCGSQGDWSAAAAVLKHENEVGGGSGGVSQALGTLAAELGQMDQAQRFFTAATEEVPHDATPWLHLANIALLRNDKGEAVRCLAEAKKRGASPEVLDSLRKKGNLGEERPAVPMMR